MLDALATARPDGSGYSLFVVNRSLTSTVHGSVTLTLPSNVTGTVSTLNGPDFTSRKTVALRFAAQEGQATPPSVVNLDQFLFGNAEKTHIFVLNPDALTLQSTRYGRFKAFSAQFLKGLALVHDVVQLDFTDRVGLRYLDHVAPRPNDSLDLYVVPEVRGLGVLAVLACRGLRLEALPLHAGRLGAACGRTSRR